MELILKSKDKTFKFEDTENPSIKEQTNGDNFIAGFEGCEEKFKVNSNLIFEVICENKPQDSEGIIWEAIK